MSDVTLILAKIEQGNAAASDELLSLVYNELRELASKRMARENPGQTLQATALVHEAFVRLVDSDQPGQWDGRAHFFAAAAEAMRRIMVERARAKSRQKRGGHLERVDAIEFVADNQLDPETVLAVNEALEQLAAEDERLASLVKLRYYSGFSLDEAAKALGISRSTAYEWWAYAKSRLKVMLDESSTPDV